jgi:hypothetical protein
MEANVAAEPPQTKGSAILATEDFSDMVAGDVLLSLMKMIKCSR